MNNEAFIEAEMNRLIEAHNAHQAKRLSNRHTEPRQQTGRNLTREQRQELSKALDAKWKPRGLHRRKVSTTSQMVLDNKPTPCTPQPRISPRNRDKWREITC